MENTHLIAPSILSADFTCLRADIEQVASQGADWIHVDVMDGHFVPNISMGPFICAATRRITRLPIEVHLMIESPERFLEAFAQAGANRLIVHVEACPHLHRTLQMIQDLDCQAGVALNPATDPVTIRPVLPWVDLVLAMTVNPGYSGQKFLPEVLPKITRLRAMLEEAANTHAMIEVDGGIDADTLPRALKAGAQVFVAATAIFKHPQGPAAGIQALRERLP